MSGSRGSSAQASGAEAIGGGAGPVAGRSTGTPAAREDAQAVIARLNLAPHPEGGWYRETWRAPATGAERAAGTAILFLLEARARSHWHRVDAAELWVFQAGRPLILSTAGAGGGIAHVTLGARVLRGHQLQHLVQPQQWQAAQAGDGWALVTCVVVPGFRFEGFELAPPDWSPPA